MESLEHNCGNISPTIYTNVLIFSKDTFVILIFRMISTNPLSSQILYFSTSHFATLFSLISFQSISVKLKGEMQHVGPFCVKYQQKMVRKINFKDIR